MKRFLIAAFAATLLGPACSDPTAGKPAAKVGEAKPEVKPEMKPEVKPEMKPEVKPEAAPMTMTYEINATNSKVEFVGAKITAEHPGSFGAFTGMIMADPKAPEKASITVDIDVKSMKTDSADLTKHLMSADFFDAEKFPKAIFTSTAIKAGGENGATHTIEGNLEMHGVKKGITFPAKVTISDTEATATAEFSIQRADWGITYPGMKDDAIKPGVLMKLDIKASVKK
jgi:polyisoprenoid-binding protein YceI